METPLEKRKLILVIAFYNRQSKLFAALDRDSSCAGADLNAQTLRRSRASIPQQCEEQDVKLVLWLALPLILTAQAFAVPCPVFSARDENTLQRLEQTWAKALEERNQNTVACLLAPEFQDADVNGAVHNREEMLAHIPQRKPTLNHLEDVHAHIFGFAAYVRGLNRVTDSSGKELARVLFTDIFIYRASRWQAVAGQETLVSDKP